MIKIIIHIFPHELEEYNRVVCKLNEDAENLKNKEVMIHSCLNLNSNICIVNSRPNIAVIILPKPTSKVR